MIMSILAVVDEAGHSDASAVAIYVAAIGAVSAAVVAYINTRRTVEGARQNQADHSTVQSELSVIRDRIEKTNRDVSGVWDALRDHADWEERQKYDHIRDEIEEAVQRALSRRRNDLGFEEQE